MDHLFIILSPVGFFKAVGIIVIIYLVLKFLGRLLFPIVVKKAVNNMQARHSQYQRQHKQEGEVTVESNRRQQNRTNTTEGEYVDFEEVD